MASSVRNRSKTPPPTHTHTVALTQGALSMYDRVLIIPALVCSRTALANDRQPSHTHEQTLGDFHRETSAKQCQITVKTLELNGHHIYIKPLYFPEDRKEHLKEVKSLDQKKKKHRVQDSDCQSGNKPDLNRIECLPHPCSKTRFSRKIRFL